MDLCTYSTDEFEINCNDIYPGGLELKKEREDPSKPRLCGNKVI